MDGLLLQTVTELGDMPIIRAGCEIWQLLQVEKEQVARKISEGSLRLDPISAMQQSEASEDYRREADWRYRGRLEARLRELNEAQNRLVDGAYGFCTDCGGEINSKRLAVDLAESLCLTCRESTEAETLFWTM